MSALAIPGAVALQTENPLADAIAEHGVTAVGVGLGVATLFAIAVGLATSFLARAVEERLLGAREAAPRVFLWTDLAIVVGLYLVGMLVASGVVAMLDGGPLALEDVTPALAEGAGADSAADPEGEGSAAAPELGYVAMFSITAAVMGVMAAYVLTAGLARRGGAAALGLAARAPAALPGARPVAGVARYLGTLPLIVASGMALQLAYIGAEGGVPAQDVAVDIAENLAAHPYFTVLFAAALIPAIEEVIFRGFLLELLIAKIGTLGGVVVSSALFAALHGWPAMAPIMVLALALAWIKLRTGSLLAPVLVHMLHNGGQVAIAYHSAR